MGMRIEGRNRKEEREGGAFMGNTEIASDEIHRKEGGRS